MLEIRGLAVSGPGIFLILSNPILGPRGRTALGKAVQGCGFGARLVV